MRTALGVGLLFAFASGCGDNTNPCAGGAAPNHVVLTENGAPALLAYRDGVGPWQPLPATSGEHDLCVTHEYEVVAVCATGGWSYAEHHATTFEENSTIIGPGCPSSLAPVRVTVPVLSVVQVYLGGFGEARASVPWNFERDVPPGTYDLFASSTFPSPTEDSRVLIRRDQKLQSTRTLDAIDLTTDGEAMVPLPLTIEGLLPDELVRTTVFWSTRPDNYASFRGNTATPFVVPPSLLRPSDDQEVTFVAGSATETRSRSRSVSTTGPDFVTSLALPQPVADIDYNVSSVVTASWTSLPLTNYTSIRLSVDADTFGAERRVQRVFATRGWVEARAANSVAFAADVPRYRDEWMLDFSNRYSRLFEVVEESASISYGSSTSDVLNATASNPTASSITAPGASPVAAPRRTPQGIGTGNVCFSETKSKISSSVRKRRS